MRPLKTALLAILLASAPAAYAETCTNEDFATTISGDAQCLVMRRFGPEEPGALLIWLHGDFSSGGPANYHFRIAESAADTFAASKALSVALVRPGYPDGGGTASSVSPTQGGRSDHYTRENVGEVAAAISRLKQHYKPAKTVLIGHSGGAATTAIILGRYPELVDGAVLVACPCDLVAWRSGRRAWSQSENPITLSDSVSPQAKVIALTGEYDNNTSPELARAYIEKLKARQIDASFQPLSGENHNSAFRAPEVLDAVRLLLR